MVAIIGLVMALPFGSARAVPAFARQTGQECQACHVGSFGPQLTAYGRAFKLNGYVWGSNESYLDHFSAMAYGGYEHTKGKEPQDASPPPLNRLASNDNVTVDQASLFYGGRLLDNVGMLAQATYKDPNRAFSWDNTDIRFADSGTLLGKDLVYGATLNNNPAVQDVWQTTPAWTFPYLASGVAAGPDPTGQPQLFGAQSQRVVGLGVYGLWNDLLYAEVSGYHALGNGAQTTLGEMSADSTDHLQGINPYWRLALQHDYGEHYLALGTYGMAFDRYPGNLRGFGTDHLTDYAVDATYQATLAGGDHIFSAYGTALRENLDLGATAAAGGASNTHDWLKTYRANFSYYYHNAYGVTLGRFATIGNADALYYGPTSAMNSQNNRPNSAGYQVQFDITPTGTQETFGYPYLNARLFVQYTYYTKFNGQEKNFDGSGHNAADNNTLYTGVWFAF
jgi:hypothetical protein